MMKTHNRRSISLSRLITVILTILCALGSVQAQTKLDIRATVFGGVYRNLRPRQQLLIQRWVAEYNRIYGKKLTPAKVYNDLPASYRTTFEAVTHALLTTALTDENGKSLGNALDLVRLVEAIHGQIRGAPGDQQFRLYVLLKADAIDKLYAAREFKRIGDNTVFHKGYPINFRLQGGTPSIQFSITRTGFRADIDVDYRSSAAYAALFNGHLTAANSDVRAGNNFDRHVNRWKGFQNWWQALFDRLFFEEKPKDEIVGALEISETPRVNGSKAVQEAVKDFFAAWLIDNKPLEAVAYVSIKSFPCTVEFPDNSQPDTPLAQMRIVKQMQDVSAQFGRLARLEQVLQGVASVAPGARPTIQPYGKIFFLQHLPDEVAYKLDCRIQLKMKLAEDIPKPGKGFSDFYGVTTRLQTGKDTSVILFQIWSKEGKDWKIVAWHLENPFKSPNVPLIATKVDPEVKKPAARADDEIASQTRAFMVEWLLNHQIDTTMERIAPSALNCAAKELGITHSNDDDPRKRARELFELIAKEAGKGRSLEDVLIAPEVSHEHVEPLVHPEAKAYVIARISDDLAKMFHCDVRFSGTRFGKDHAQGAPLFNLQHYKTVFQLKRGGQHPAAFAMVWEKQGNDWKVIAFDILDH